MMLSVDGGENDRDGMTVQEKESSADGELDWVSEFVQKREEREMVNRLKVEELKCLKTSERVNKLLAA